MGQVGLILVLGFKFGEEAGYSFDMTEKQFIEEGEGEFILDSYEGNIIFLFTNIIYFFTVIAFTVSKPWRKEFYTNIPFTAALFLSMGYSSAMIVMPNIRLGLLDIVHMEYQPLNWLVLGSSWGLGIVILVVQKCILEPYFNKR